MTSDRESLGDMEYEFHWVYCPDCNQTLVCESRLEGAGDRFEQVVCPVCGRELGEIRSDGGYDFIGLACGYLNPDRPCSD
jgi:ribosomal protein S27E